MSKLFDGEGYKITVIGGGTGLSVILRGLKKITENLAAVVTMSDDGGGSGILREDLGMLPPGDIRSCLLALADMEDDMEELFKFRFERGKLAGQNMGNIILAGLNCMSGSFVGGLVKAHDILRIRGKVIPVTDQDIALCAKLENGAIVRGESRIPRVAISEGSPIKEVFLDPSIVFALSYAKEAIKRADIIIMGPGSLYTSILPNLLVNGITEELENSEAIKVLICNVMTQPGETDGYSVFDHVEKVRGYLGNASLDYVIVNSEIPPEEHAERYAEDGANPVFLKTGEKEKLEEMGIVVISGEFSDIKHGYIRHDADRISGMILALLNA